jgi:uncharacterized protein
MNPNSLPIAAPDHLSEDAVSALNRLEQCLVKMKSVVVAFSGGVDSALVLDVAHRVLGENARALTAISPTFPPEEQEIAIEFAQQRNVEHILLETNELEEEGYAKNDGRRCYFCKSELFSLAQVKAEEMGVPWVLDGTIMDDLGEHRPGLDAASENLVRHPLVEARFTKSLVREVAKYLGIHVWNKPSFACLGSRFAVGTTVTLERILQVQRVESTLRGLGFVQFRARWHEVDNEPLVRIELSGNEMMLMVQENIRQTVVETCKSEGFKWVTIDLMGYQRGSGSKLEETTQQSLK